MTSTTARPALPVWRTVGEAFASVPANLAALLRIFWAWIAIYWASVAIVVGIWTLLWPTRPPVDAPSSAFMVPFLLLCAVAATGFSSAAVAWHRLLLLREQPPLFYLRVGGQVPRYLGRLLVIILIATAIQVFCALLLWRAGLVLPPPSPDAPIYVEDLITQMLVALIMFVATVLVMTRLSISLPGIAIERPMTLGATLRLTRGNAWRLCGGTLLIYAPSLVFGFLLGVSAASSNMLATLLLICASFFSTVATISFLSLGYRFFADTPQPVQPQPS